MSITDKITGRVKQAAGDLAGDFPIGATFLTAGRLAGLSSTRLAVATRLAAVAALTALRRL